MKQVMIFGDGKESRSHLGKIIRRRANQILIEYEDWDYDNQCIVLNRVWFQRRSYYDTCAKYESRDKENLWYYEQPLSGYAAYYYMSSNNIKFGENTMLDAALLSDAESVYYHALCNIRGPFPEGVETLKKSPKWLFDYITDVPGAYNVKLASIVVNSSKYLRNLFFSWYLTNAK